MLQLNEISTHKLVPLLLIGAFLFLGQKLITSMVGKWVNKDKQESLLSVYLPIIGNIIWILFFLYAVYELSLFNPLFAIFTAVLAIVLTWNFVKDFVHGTLFRIQKGNLVGQQIKVGNFSGEVVQMNTTRLDVQLDNGEIAQYPYSKLTREVFAISTSVKDYKFCTLRLNVSFTKEVDTLKRQIHAQLLSIPWIVSTMNIKTELVHQDSETLDFKITAYTLDEKFISKIQQAIDLIEFD